MRRASRPRDDTLAVKESGFFECRFPPREQGQLPAALAAHADVAPLETPPREQGEQHGHSQQAEQPFDVQLPDRVAALEREMARFPH